MNSEKQRGWGWQKAFVAKAERLLRLKLETCDNPILIQFSVCGKETERWPSGGTAVGLLAEWILHVVWVNKCWRAFERGYPQLGWNGLIYWTNPAPPWLYEILLNVSNLSWSISALSSFM
jgi:hypothetical protein